MIWSRSRVWSCLSITYLGDCFTIKSLLRTLHLRLSYQLLILYIFSTSNFFKSISWPNEVSWWRNFLKPSSWPIMKACFNCSTCSPLVFMLLSSDLQVALVTWKIPVRLCFYLLVDYHFLTHEFFFFFSSVVSFTINSTHKDMNSLIYIKYVFNQGQ